jgi:hypothetical protein
LKKLYFLVVLVFISCAYTPTKDQYKDIFTEAIFVDIEISNKQLENFIFLKDEIILSLRTKFGIKIVNKSKNVKTLSLKFMNISHIPIEYDGKGHVSRYSTRVVLKSTYIYNGKKITRITKGAARYKYNESLVEDTSSKKYEINEEASLIYFKDDNGLDGKKIEAIKDASLIAFKKFISGITL